MARAYRGLNGGGAGSGEIEGARGFMWKTGESKESIGILRDYFLAIRVMPFELLPN